MFIDTQGEIQSIVDLDLDFLRSARQQKPDPWGTSQPHNAYMETSILQRPFVGHETRLESGQITLPSNFLQFHESVDYSPQKLAFPDYMTSLSLITQKLGSGFKPNYPPLNDFENSCKNNWTNIPVRDAELFTSVLSFFLL